MPATASYWEESYRWVAVHELLTGPALPFLEYQADHYQGGSLVMILLSLPFMAVFGESPLTLKLSALLVSTAILVLLFLVSRRAYGGSAALLAGAAYTVGPPLLAFRGLVVMGSHWESVLFSLAQLWIFLDLLSGRRRTVARWAAFGAWIGFGFWFCYTAALTTLACVITWLLLERRPRANELAAAATGMVAGLVPWVLYNALHGYAGLTRIVEIFGGGDPIDHWTEVSTLSKLWSLLTHDLPVGLAMPFTTPLPESVATVLTVTVAVPFACGVAASFTRASRLLRWRFAGRILPEGDVLDALRAELVFPVYALVFVAAFLASAFTVEPRYGAWAYRLFTPLAALLLIPAAISVAAAMKRGGRGRALALSVCGVAFASSLTATTALAVRKPDVMQHLTPVIGYMSMGLLLHRKYEGNLDVAVAAARKIPDPDMRLRVGHGIGWGMQHRFESRDDLTELASALREIPLPDRAAVVLGLRQTALRRRMVVAEMLAGDPSDENRRLGAALERLSRFALEQWYALPVALREAVSRVQQFEPARKQPLQGES